MTSGNAEPNTVADLMVAAARRWPGSIAITTEDAVLSYTDLHASAAACARLYRERGLHAGDRVAVLLSNGWPYAIAYLGAQYAGLIVVLVNARLSAPEIAFVIDDSGAKLLITSEDFADRCVGIGIPVVSASEFVPLVAGDDPAANGFEAVHRSASDTVQLLYTSGTTGRPKGARQTNANLLANAATVRDRFALTPADSTLIVAPMFHATGTNSQLIGFLSAGARCVVEPSFSTARSLATLARERVTVFAGVATMLQLMMRRPEFEELDLSALRLFIMGGSPVPDAVPIEARKRMPHTSLANVWGLTEATSIVTYVDGDDYLRHPWSVGAPVPGVEVGIALPDGVVSVVPEVDGELCVRGATVADGYWNKPEATAAAFRDGWLHTGDIGSISAEGYVAVKDRLKDMIIRGGENIYSLEVETALAAHPAVADVAVVGVADELFGEQVRAVVVIAAGSELTSATLRAHAATVLADYKVPSEVLFLDELPRNPSGKVLKTALSQLPAPTA